MRRDCFPVNPAVTCVRLFNISICVLSVMNIEMRPHGLAVLSFDDAAFDMAYGSAVCHRLRRDGRITHASHATDYDGLRLKVTTQGPHVKAEDVFQEVCLNRAAEISTLQELLTRALADYHPETTTTFGSVSSA